MNRLFYFALMVVGIVSNAYSQNDEENQNIWKHKIGVETSFMFPAGDIIENIPIRQNVNSFYTHQSSSGQVSSYSNTAFYGAKYEIFNDKFRIGISSGIRYYNHKTEISGYSSYNSDFFYLRYTMEGNETKFARIKNIYENKDFVSIPLEIKYIFFQPNQLGFFASVGTDFSLFKTVDKVNIDFFDDKMNEFEQEVIKTILRQTNDFKSTLYVSFGIRYAEKDKIGFALEFIGPYAFITNDNFTLIDFYSSSGVRFSVEIPLNY
jgi:hypothetical protein